MGMASLVLPCSITPSRPNTSPPPRHCYSTRKRRLAVSCSDRRGMLLGLGLYGGAAIAAPFPPQSSDTCTKGTDLNTQQPVEFNCCPPKSTSGPRPFVFPDPGQKPRIRPALQDASPEYIAKLEKAVKAAKELDPSDPRGFAQQAHIHCAFCNLVYSQTPDSDKKLQIHFSWFFLPWHRWYLYFYERILGKLIGDPTFALPFWNWDNPPGMIFPDAFKNPNSTLYNPRRNKDHYDLTPDLKYGKEDDPSSTLPPSQIIKSNLAEMRAEMITNGKTLENFYGNKYVVGSADAVTGQGSLEAGSHTSLHVWVGEANQQGFDMGNFSTAGQDVLFYAHHANIDRLWNVWRDIRKEKSRPSYFTDTDWLDTQFVFYDENAELVTVKVADSLDSNKLGFTWQPVPNRWMDAEAKPKAVRKKSNVAKLSKAPKATDKNIFPAKLDKGVLRVLVDRPKRRRSAAEKEKQEEELLISGIEVVSSKFVRFEVFVNDEDVKPEELIAAAEYVGSYSQMPVQTQTGKVNCEFKLGLSDLLEELDIEDDDKILVSIVPKAGGKFITIGGIKVVFEDI